MQDLTTPEHFIPNAKSRSLNKRLVFLIVGLVLIPPVLIVAAIVFVAQPVRIVGAAMSPTLNDGDRVFVSKAFLSIKRGDIVIFYFPLDRSKSFIKRVVGLPGDTIDVGIDGRITINGQPLDEPYLSPERNQNPQQRWKQVREEFKHISPDSYFVMGDNRDAANDSRSWGTVPKSLIYGKFLSRYWPPKPVTSL